MPQMNKTIESYFAEFSFKFKLYLLLLLLLAISASIVSILVGLSAERNCKCNRIKKCCYEPFIVWFTLYKFLEHLILLLALSKHSLDGKNHSENNI